MIKKMVFACEFNIIFNITFESARVFFPEKHSLFELLNYSKLLICVIFGGHAILIKNY